MCGIAGYISFNRERLNADIIQGMTDALVSRGPDDYGFFTFDIINGDKKLFKFKKKN